MTDLEENILLDRAASDCEIPKDRLSIKRVRDDRYVMASRIVPYHRRIPVVLYQPATQYYLVLKQNLRHFRTLDAIAS
jgi:hypothetical protein